MSMLSPQILQQALEELPVAAAIVDLSERGWPVIWANRALSQRLGGSKVTGMHWLDMAEPVVAGLSGEAALAQLVSRRCTGQWLLRSGSALAGEIGIESVPLPGPDGRPACLLLSATPGEQPLAPRAAPTRRSSSAQRLDPVTGLPLQEPLLEVLARDWGIARRSQRRVSLILFRVEALDSYRRLFGRHAADSCLKRISNLLAACLRRAGDYCARLDEDCFAAIVDNEQELQVRSLAAQISERVRNLGIHHPRVPSRFVTVSCGVASAIPGNEDLQQTLLERAQEELAALPATIVEATVRLESSAGAVKLQQGG